VCNNLLLGVDLSADWLDADDRHEFLTTDDAGRNFLNSARFERDFIYGISGRLGYKSWDFATPFVRLGIERAHNKLQYDLDLLDPAPAVRQLGIAKSHTETGYLVGLGLDIPVFNNNTNVRIEYQYHWQNRADFDFVNVGNTFAGTADLKPKAHFLTIGLLWSQV
jgi:opacity protein-like surface antigen